MRFHDLRLHTSLGICYPPSTYMYMCLPSNFVYIARFICALVIRCWSFLLLLTCLVCARGKINTCTFEGPEFLGGPAIVLQPNRKYLHPGPRGVGHRQWVKRQSFDTYCRELCDTCAVRLLITFPLECLDRNSYLTPRSRAPLRAVGNPVGRLAMNVDRPSLHGLV